MTVNKLMTFIFAAVLGTVATLASANSDQDQKIVDRIKPVGSVCISGEECAAAGGAAATASSGPRSGEQVYNTYCAACHGSGAMNSPKSGDTAVWDTRLAKGFDNTLANAINGLNLMPPKGTCGDCSDEELGNAIKFMAK